MIGANMNFNDYQSESNKTAKYPEDRAIEYLALGLASEAGEVAGKIKKVIRDDSSNLSEERRSQIASELGDVLWYISQLALELNVSLESVAAKNIEKLSDRNARGAIGGSGDNR